MAYLDETGDPVLDALYEELDAIKGNTRAESLRRIELKDQIRAIREQQGAMRDLGVGSLRFGAFMTMAPEIDWLANKMATNVGYPMMLASEEYQSFPQKEKEDFRNLWLAAQGERGDEQHHEWGKKQLNKYHDMGFLPWMEQVPEFIDELVPFEKTLGSKAVEDAELLLVAGWGIHGIAKLFSWAATKGIPKGRVWLRDKIKSIVKNKQGEEILDDIVPKDIVPEASLQIEHKPLFEARIDKTVERAAAGEKVKPKPAKTKPKTGKEFDQKWTQKKDEFQSKYDQDVEAIYASAPAGKITPEKIERVEALTKKLKKRIDKVYVEMDKDFAYLEEQAKIKYAADRKKIEKTKESISAGEIPEEIIEKLLDKRLLKTDPKHFQGTKEYTAWKMDKDIAYTRSMLVDEADKLYKWYNKTLDSLYEANNKAGDEILASATAKIKKTKGGTLEEQKARFKDIEAQFNVELKKSSLETDLQRKEIEAIYAKGKEKLEKASVSLEKTLKKEQADLAAGKITRHARGGLVENKVNYALNQWK